MADPETDWDPNWDSIVGPLDGYRPPRPLPADNPDDYENER